MVKECTCNMTYMTWTFLLLGNDTMMFETVVKKKLEVSWSSFFVSLSKPLKMLEIQEKMIRVSDH